MLYHTSPASDGSADVYDIVAELVENGARLDPDAVVMILGIASCSQATRFQTEEDGTDQFTEGCWTGKYQK